jgi:hypothetical protein
MSLIGFHRFLIAAAILFCGGFAIWQFLAFLDQRRAAPFLMAIAFAVAAVAFGYYLRHLSRFLRLPPDQDAS